jgi:ribosomal protein S18 acetylase RimI-like enzyme
MTSDLGTDRSSVVRRRSSKKLRCLHDKEEIEAFLRRNTYLHIYSIGDLDDFFWPHTVWYALEHDGEIKQIVLVYTAFDTPTVLAFTEPPVGEMRDFLHSAMRLLPKRFYTHLTEGLRSVLEADYYVTCHGTFYKMALTDTTRLDTVDTSAAERLSRADLPDIEELYHVSYPGNWFDPRMLDTRHYYGIRRDGQLVSIAGVHVYSERYKVAALGNVTTHPQLRGQGIASAACAKLCQELLRTVDHIGLNVQADNRSAVSAYERLGFAHIATYEECSVELMR